MIYATEEAVPATRGAAVYIQTPATGILLLGLSSMEAGYE